MSKSCIPLIQPWLPKQAIVCHRGSLISQSEFLNASTSLARQLPPSRYVINLCQDRYNFLQVFVAAIINGTTNLLPSNPQASTITEIVMDFPNAICVVDYDSDISQVPVFDLRQRDSSYPATDNPEVPMINAEHIAAVAFTSGSTGKPQAHNKHWKTLAGTAALLGKRFCQAEEQTSVVATVPSQHMYGLEMTVMMALQAGCLLETSQPFYPQDVCATLKSTPLKRLLVTTPVHLRALEGSQPEDCSIDRIISATAPLDPNLAASAEQTLSSLVYEIYGCTEAGSLATRHTSQNSLWALLDGITFTREGQTVYANSSHLLQATAMDDELRLLESPLHFELLGRSSDMLNVGGKRNSLSHLTHKLLSIAGIDDAVVFLPTGKVRPAALVVSSRPANEILQLLAELIDPVFLPRPLRKVSALPRNETGKLPHKSLVELLNKK